MCSSPLIWKCGDAALKTIIREALIAGMLREAVTGTEEEGGAEVHPGGWGKGSCGLSRLWPPAQSQAGHLVRRKPPCDRVGPGGGRRAVRCVDEV